MKNQHNRLLWSNLDSSDMSVDSKEVIDLKTAVQKTDLGTKSAQKRN